MAAGLSLSQPLSGLLSTVRAQLPKPVGRAILAPGGSVAWDDCCDGQLWVRVGSITPNYATSRSGVRSAACTPYSWSLDLAVGILRCAAVLSDDGTPPSPRQITADANEMIDDVQALAAGVSCYEHDGLENVLLGTWTPLGPNGGCHGGEWRVTATVLACECPPEASTSTAPLGSK